MVLPSIYLVTAFEEDVKGSVARCSNLSNIPFFLTRAWL